jgi:glycosyltransferase involved in cell wall biosynthesis
LLLNLGRYAFGWFELFTHQIQQLQRQLGRSFRQAAPVEVLFDLLADAEMPRLYASATHYISLSHGEGWDQTMVEAAASGLRLIAPDHSAYRAYLSPDTATMIPSREVPARFEGDPPLQALFSGANWWEPDIDAGAVAIRGAIDGQDGEGRGAREHVPTHFTWQQSTRRLLDILSELAVSAAR